MDAVLRDLRYAVRMLLRTPGVTVAAVLALALGIGATTGIFSVVHAVLLRSLGWGEESRLVAVRGNFEAQNLIGIYGVTAYGVTQRTREIGVRIAIGAQRRDVLRMVMVGAVKLAAVGVALGLCGALIGARLLSSQLYGVGSRDPLTYAAMSALLAAVALVASWLPARRATRVDPMVALRTE